MSLWIQTERGTLIRGDAFHTYQVTPRDHGPGEPFALIAHGPTHEVVVANGEQEHLERCLAVIAERLTDNGKTLVRFSNGTIPPPGLRVDVPRGDPDEGHRGD